MFYAQFVLSKKGPLAKIWLAAHMEKKLTKAQIFETNVQDAVDEILTPKVKLSLRTTGHLLLGIVRIYSRKAKYLMMDCNEAFLKIRQAFSHGIPEIANSRAESECTEIPELNDFINDLPDINGFEISDVGNISSNQSHLDLITMKESSYDNANMRIQPFDTTSFDGDDFGEKQLLHGAHGLDDSFQEEEEHRRDATANYSEHASHRGSLLHESQTNGKRSGGLVDELDEYGHAEELDGIFDNLNQELDLGPVTPMEVGGSPNKNVPATQDSFTLEPLDTAALNQQREAQEKPMRQKRKRRLVVDDHKNISGDDMKANMADYSDTIQPLDLAPPTKLLMRLKKNGAVEKLFSMPGCTVGVQDPQILKLYQSHLVLFARDVNERLGEDVRHELEMVDNLEDDFLHLEDEFGGQSPVPMATPLHEIDENIELNGVQNTVITPEKQRSARKSRTHDREEEEEDEDEQVFTRRNKSVLHSIAVKLRANDNQILFEDLFNRSSTKRTAAQKFYALLELHKWQAIQVDQDEPYGPIQITGGERMDDLLTAQ